MNILVTNDDGVYSEGLRRLAEAHGTIGRVTVVAPDREQSASSHSLTLNHPLRILRLDDQTWSVDGTPADCVNLAVQHIMRDNRPDVVVSGINFGPNLGDDVIYSGTISAAFEGSILGIPSIAFSAVIGENFSFERSAGFAVEFTRLFIESKPAHDVVMNVNFPVEAPRGVRITHLGKRVYTEGVIERQDPRGRSYFWIGGDAPEWEDVEGTDFAAIDRGYISITPLHLDLTHRPSIERLSRIREKLGPFDGDS
ncbi:MAG: 5'/3'-nucleotidase SurE [Thermoanaerobaculia bacterium]|nr:5'/3'-nucleotidase SurE [Thermoanaerobaculia bacterium]